MWISAVFEVVTLRFGSRSPIEQAPEHGGVDFRPRGEFSDSIGFTYIHIDAGMNQHTPRD